VVTLLAAFVLRFWYAQAYVYGHLVPLVLAGYLSHLVMDSFNPQGVPWLWPLRKHFGLPLVKTGSFLERIAVVPAILILCGWLAWSFR
jgi:inner membrane protein